MANLLPGRGIMIEAMDAATMLVLQQPIYLDATMREGHTFTAKATEHPIEDGSKITDHIIHEPFRLDIDGMVSSYDEKAENVGGNKALAAQEILTTLQDRIPFTLMALIAKALPKNANSSQMNAASNGMIMMTAAGTAAANVMEALSIANASKNIASNRSKWEFFKNDQRLGSYPQPRATDVFHFLESNQEDGNLFRITTRIAQYDNMVLEKFDVPRDPGIGTALRFTMSFKKIVIVSSEVGQVPKIKKPGKGTGKKTPPPAKPPEATPPVTESDAPEGPPSAPETVLQAARAFGIKMFLSFSDFMGGL